MMIDEHFLRRRSSNHRPDVSDPFQDIVIERKNQIGLLEMMAAGSGIMFVYKDFFRPLHPFKEVRKRIRHHHLRLLALPLQVLA